MNNAEKQLKRSSHPSQIQVPKETPTTESFHPQPRIERIIDRIWERLSAYYGNRFSDFWAGFENKMQSIKKIWAEELIDYSDEEIIAGLNSCKTKIFPPTLPEFLLLCRPPINPETAFYEAITQWENRKSFSDHWSNPAIYYAASKIGNDLSFITYDKIKFRWINAINQANEEIRSGNLPNKVPERLNELAKPQEIKISKQKANENIERIKSMISGLSERKII